MLYYYMIVLSVFLGLWLLVSVSDHLLSVLLCLEMLVLGVYFLFMLSLDPTAYYYSLIYLVMTVCEGALGLSMMVIMGYVFSGDYFKSFNLFF